MYFCNLIPKFVYFAARGKLWLCCNWTLGDCIQPCGKLQVITRPTMECSYNMIIIECLCLSHSLYLHIRQYALHLQVIYNKWIMKMMFTNMTMNLIYTQSWMGATCPRLVSWASCPWWTGVKIFSWKILQQFSQPELNPELELDFSQLHFGSHSSGGHVAVEFLKKGCSDVKVFDADDWDW